MKRMTLVGIVAATTILAISGAVLVNGLTKTDQVAETPVAVVSPTTEEKTVEPVAEVPPVVEVPLAPQQETIQEEAPARTFAEIILDYPNMSEGDYNAGCSNLIYDHIPERFTPDVAERNVKLISKVFVSSCAAVGGIHNSHFRYLDDIGQGDFFTRFASYPLE